MAMIAEVEAAGGPPWKLYYLTRSPAQTAFREELRALRVEGRDPP